jgi:hypothetical protein
MGALLLYELGIQKLLGRIVDHHHQTRMLIRTKGKPCMIAPVQMQ